MRGEDFPPCFLYYLLEIAKLIKMCMVHNLHSLDLSFAIAGFLYIQIYNPAQKLRGKEDFTPPAQIADHIFSS